MSEQLEELKDKAEDFLDRNNDGKVNVEDFNVLEKKQKVVVAAIAGLFILIVLNVLGSIFGAFKSDEPRKAPVEAVETSDAPEVAEQPQASVIHLSDGTIQALADAVAVRVSVAGGDTVDRVENLEKEIEALQQQINNHDVHLQQLQKAIEEGPKKRKRFLGIF